MALWHALPLPHGKTTIIILQYGGVCLFRFDALRGYAQSLWDHRAEAVSWFTFSLKECGYVETIKNPKSRLDSLLFEKGKYRAMKEADIDVSTVYAIGEKLAQIVEKSEDDIASFICKHKGRIHYIDYSGFRKYKDLVESSVYVEEDGSFDILLPAYVPFVENRFTLAHELGHYILHREEGVPMFACRSGDTRVEKEANCFALGFLMPRERFIEAKKRIAERNLRFAFQVPEFAIQARIKSLSLQD